MTEKHQIILIYEIIQLSQVDVERKKTNKTPLQWLRSSTFRAVLPAMRQKASFRAGLKPITAWFPSSAIAAAKTEKIRLALND